MSNSRASCDLFDELRRADAGQRRARDRRSAAPAPASPRATTSNPEPDEPAAAADRDPRRLLEPLAGRGLVRADGHGHADHRPGARLLPGRRVRARGRVRPRLRRRRRDDRLSAGAHDVVARPHVAAVVAWAWRRAMEALLTGDSHDRRRGGRGGIREPRVPRRPSSRPKCSTSPSGSRRSRATSSRSTSARCTARWRRMGMRTGLRATTELQALGLHQRSSKEYMPKLRSRRREGCGRRRDCAVRRRTGPIVEPGPTREPRHDGARRRRRRGRRRAATEARAELETLVRIPSISADPDAPRRRAGQRRRDRRAPARARPRDRSGSPASTARIRT